ncbi:hypothetical protein OAP52_05095 [Hellea sp.]|nr:hypothetical protein [Hellea sp.]
MKKEPEYKNVDSYCNLDLSADSKAMQKLMSQRSLNREGKSEEIVLSDVVGAAPSNITPHMRNWFNSTIERLRKPALDEINELFGEVSADKSVGGTLLERKIDQISDTQILDKRSASKLNQQQNTSGYSILDENKKAYAEAARMYDRRKMERRREPKMIGFFYWLLIAFVGIFELLINFEAFAGLDIMTPATALGSTVVIAMLLALASHYHGTFLKEFQFRFGERGREGDRGVAFRQMALATFALCVVLAAVWYARADFMEDKILEASVIGGTPPSWVSTVGGSLLQNIGVWVVGVIISYMFHDQDPEFPELRKSRDLHSKKYRKLEKSLNEKLEKQYKKIDTAAKLQKSDAKQFDTSISHEEKFITARKQFDRLSSQDASVIGMLQQYQSEFVNLASDNDIKIQIVDDTNSTGKRDISPSDYGSKQITLKHL